MLKFEKCAQISNFHFYYNINPNVLKTIPQQRRQKLVRRCACIKKVMKRKYTASARVVQVVSGLASLDVDPTQKVGLNETKYPGYLILSLSKLSILNESKTKLH